MYEACIDTKIWNDQMKIDAKKWEIHAFATLTVMQIFWSRSISECAP